MEYLKLKILQVCGLLQSRLIEGVAGVATLHSLRKGAPNHFPTVLGNKGIIQRDCGTKSTTMACAVALPHGDRSLEMNRLL